MHPSVYSSIIYNSHDVKAIEVSINRWADKEDALYIHSGILLSRKRKDILLFATTWVDLEGVMFSETSQRKTNVACFHLYAGYQIKQMNKYNKTETGTDTENKLVVTKGEKGEGRVQIG